MQHRLEPHPRKVGVRLPGKGNSNSRGARLVHLIITMINWIRTRRFSLKDFDLYNTLDLGWDPSAPKVPFPPHRVGLSFEPSLSLSQYQKRHLSFSLSLFLSISLYLSLFVSLFLGISDGIALYLSLCLCLSLSLSLSLS
jgi:hypothetical protein